MIFYAKGKERRNGREFYPRGFTLEGHTRECAEMALFLLTKVPFGRLLHQKMALQIPYEDFVRVCLLAVILHDIGKSGPEFFGMIESQILGLDRRKQNYRHEILSAIILFRLWKWLVKAAGNKRYAKYVLSAVRGHHIKTEKELNDSSEKIREWRAVDVIQIYNDILAQYGFPHITDAPWKNNAVKLSSRQVALANRIFREDEHFSEDQMAETPESLAVKFVLVLSDTLGSLSWKSPEQQPGFNDTIKDFVRQIYAPRNIDYKSRIQGWDTIQHTLRDFQKDIQTVEGDAILQAFCGGGKTAAVLLWASRCPQIPLVITTPTTGTSSQLFQDYGRIDQDFNRHSRASVDSLIRWLAKQNTNVPDFLNPYNEAKEVGEKETPEKAWEKEEQEAAEESLAVADTFASCLKDVTFATVDQVLGVMSYSRKSILWLLYLVMAQMAFDEFHAYDEELTRWHQQFLRFFPGIRTLNLSATIAEQQRRRVLDVRPHAQFITTKESDGDKPRYQLHLLGSEQEALTHFRDARKVLWISNKVADCQRVAALFDDALCYHARFRYYDRVAIHAEMVAAFRDKQELREIRAVTTQVAEMSLDISAMLGIFALCPFVSLIQRLGRINRMLEYGVADVYIYRPERPSPYVMVRTDKAVEEVFRSWEDAIRPLLGRPVSQRELMEHAASLPAGVPPDLNVYQPMIATARRSLRDGGTYSIVLQQDWEKNPKRFEDSRIVSAYEIPTNEYDLEEALKAKREGREVHHRLVLPREYDARLGLFPKKGIIR
jgi:CRISPR-associated endonuclease/helicase Cas3